nr:aldehyde dehydrogenase family protein [Sinirhodobacter populi]
MVRERGAARLWTAGPCTRRRVTQQVRKEPIGPVVAFTPWNFPVSQMVRKVAAALAAGCSVLLKGPEKTPLSCAELARTMVDAGLPPGALCLLYGNPAEISERLIKNPVICKVSFTGSTAVGKHLAAPAGSVMKPVTMELGGHSPAVVFADADAPRAVEQLVWTKYLNAGRHVTDHQPRRFMKVRHHGGHAGRPHLTVDPDSITPRAVSPP